MLEEKAQQDARRMQEEIERNREDRKHKGSVGNDSGWAAPCSSPSVAKLFPQFTTAPQ